MKKILLLLVLFLFASSSFFPQDVPFQFGNGSSVITLKFSPDDAYLVSYSSGDGMLCMWEVKSGRLLWKRPTSAVQKADEYYTLTSFAWSADQKRLVSGSGNGTIQLWDANTGGLLWRTDAHHDSVTAVAFAPDGKTIVSAASPQSGIDEIKIFEAKVGQFIKEIKGRSCTVVALAFDAAGYVRTGNLDGNVTKWNIGNGIADEKTIPEKCVQRRTYEWETSFSEDLKIAAVKTSKTSLILKNTQSNEVIKSIAIDDIGRTYSRFNADATKLIVSGNAFNLYDLKNDQSQKIEEFTSPGGALDLSGDGKLFAQAGGGSDHSVRITDVSTGYSRYLDGHPSTIKTIAYSLDGRTLAFAGNDKTVYLLDTETKKLVGKLVKHDDPINVIAFAPDGQTLMSVDDQQNARLWNYRTGKLLNSFKTGDGQRDADKLEFSSNGKYFILLINGDLKLWDAKALTQKGYIKTTEGYESKSGNMTTSYSAVPVSTAAFSKDGTKIFTGHYDGTVRTWDAASGNELKKFKVGESVGFLVSSPDEKRFLAMVGDREKAAIKLFDRNNGKEIERFGSTEHLYMEALSISPNGTRFATSFIKGEVLLWDVNKMDPIRECDSGLSGDDAIAFSPDGKTFAAGGDGQNLYIFDAEKGDKIWQLLVEYQPGELEKKLEAEAEKRRTILNEAKAILDKQAAIGTEKYRKQVYITFDHYGDMSDPGEKRMVESDELKESKVKKEVQDSNAAWLRLHNDSPLPVTIPTQSMYLPNGKCFFTFPNGKKMNGLCENREISIWHGLKDKNDKWIPFGFDFGSSAVLLPNKSVLFPVLREVLKNGNSIVFDFTFMKDGDNGIIEAYGTAKTLKLSELDLPKK